MTNPFFLPTGPEGVPPFDAIEPAPPREAHGPVAADRRRSERPSSSEEPRASAMPPPSRSSPTSPSIPTRKAPQPCVPD